MPPREKLADYWRRIQQELFPFLAEVVGPLGERDLLFVAVLEMARLERFVPRSFGGVGRPPACRVSLARAFVAKVVFEIATTTLLVERLRFDRRLRRLCGWERVGELPSEATFSRAFAAFAASTLPERAHAAVIEASQAGRLIGHIARDSSAIHARERPVKGVVRPAKPAKRQKRGRPRKSEARPATIKPPRRLAQQPTMSLEAMLADLPRACSIGTKRNAKGHHEIWRGYKLHVDVADGDIPISCVLTSAHVHDSQVAIPLATITARRVTSLYDLMDSAYQATEIREHSRSLGHVPLIDTVARSATQKADHEAETRARRTINLPTAETVRFKARTASERVFGRLKDQAGGSTIRVRGPTKVMCHLMFGILVLTVDQITRLIP
jgi:hypothetical protein